MFVSKSGAIRSLAIAIVASCAFLGSLSSAYSDPPYLPSTKIGTAALINPANADSFYGSGTTSSDGLSALTGSATPVPPEIILQADALKNDPDLIYQYVENNIQTVWMYGLQKGALGALIDKSGTPFDQAELMVALLRQAGFTTSYVASTIYLSQAQFYNWTGISDALAACQMLSSGGIPAQINDNATSTTCSAFTAGTAISHVRMAHIWVQVTIPGSHTAGCSSGDVCVFDPSYKNYTWKAGINLATATGLTPNDPLNAAKSTMVDCTGSGPVCVHTLNTVGTGGLNNKLLAYTTSYLSYLQTNHLQGAQIEDIVSGGVITPSNVAVRQQAVPYVDGSAPYTHVWTPPSDPARYNAIPNAYRTTLEAHGMVRHYTALGPPPVYDNDTTAFDPTFYVDEIYGRKLTAMTDFHGPPDGLAIYTDYFHNNITLLLDGAPMLNVPTYDNTVPGNAFSPRGLPAHIALVATHPYAAAADGSASATGGYMKATIDKPVDFITAVSIVHGWGDTSQALFTKWSNEDWQGRVLPHYFHQPYCHGGIDTCPPLYQQPTGDFEREKTGASWMAQMTRATQLNAAIAHSVSQIHHVLGFVYGDQILLPQYNQGDTVPPDFVINDSFDRIDVDTGLSVTSKTAVAADRRVAIQSIAAASAALEGSIPGQLSDVPDMSSTATRFEWANKPPVDAKQNPVPLGPRNFYLFTSTNASAATGLAQVDGVTSTTSGGIAAWSAQPAISNGEMQSWRSALSTDIQSYANQGFTVVASQEAFLGPGQRGGAIIPGALVNGNPTDYTHWSTKQRGGAFVATQYDANGDPLQIAHIQVGQRTEDGKFIITKGGGGGVQTNTASTYNPSTAADILKSQFVDRSNALGVNLSNGSMSYTSPASLQVGNGGFPYELSGSLTWHPAPPNTSFAPNSPTPPQRGWATNWQNQLALSSSGFEAMGQSDIRDAAGAIVAFLSAQDIYRSALAPERDVAAVLATAWWSDHIVGNVATVSVGQGSRQLVHLPNDEWIEPGTGYSTLVQNNPRTAYEWQCPVTLPQPYAMSRGWDSSSVSFDLTNANGDVQHFANWTNSYFTDDVHPCGQFKGFRLTDWTFPQGAPNPLKITLTYGDPYDPNGTDPHIEQLIKVSNSIGREIDFLSTAGRLDSFNNGLGGVDLREVIVNAPPVGGQFAPSMLDPAGKQTSFLYNQTSQVCPPCRPSVFPMLSYVFTADKPDSSNLANANVEYDYDGLGRVYQVRDAVAIQQGTRGPYAFYIADGTRGERDDPLGQAYSVVYDTYAHPARYIDEMAHETKALFDSRGRISHYLYPEGDCEVFDYDDHNNTTDFWKVDTASACNTGAGSTHVLHASAAWDQTWNKPHTVTNARGYTTTLDYFTSGAGKSLLQTATRPTITEGTPVYSFTYDTYGRPQDTTGPTGIITHNAYSGTAPYNLTSTVVDYATGHLNLTTSFGYDAQGDVVSTTDPRTFVTTSKYDLDRRKTEDDRHNGDASAALIAATKTIYDDVGRDKEDDAGTVFSGTSVSTWQMMKQTTYTPTSKVDAVTDADGKVTNTDYDDADRVLTVTDPVSRKVHFVYCDATDTDCAANQIKKEIRAWVSSPNCSNGTTLQECYRRPTYYANGELKTLKDANGNTTAYDYDGWRRLTKTTFPDSSSDYEFLTLDEDGNVLTRRNRANETLNYTYNELDWARQKASPNPAVTDYWTYLLDGRIDTLCDVAACGASGSILDYGYDTAGRLIQVINHIPGFGSNRTVNYTLDANGNRTKLAWPSQDAAYYVGYCYDSLNRMTAAMENSTSSSCATNLLATYAYDPLSRRTSVAYGNGASMSYPSYSNAGELLALNHDMSGSADDPHYSFAYTDAHQLQTDTVSDNDYAWQPALDGTDSYAMVNALNQYPSITPGGGSVRALGYDLKGNLTSGNIDGSGSWTFGYDAENRMLSACKPSPCSSPTVNAAYAYDPLGRRFKKSGTGVTTTYFLNDGTDEIAEYDSTKKVTNRYIPGPAIDEPVAMENASTDAKEYFHTNRQGSVIAMSDDSGAKVEGPYVYDPHGNCFSAGSACSSSGEPYRFTGRRLDAETGLLYYRARYYWPQGGRFLQTDPIGYTADLNLYTYVGNDPTDGIDPTGMDRVCTVTTGSSIPSCVDVNGGKDTHTLTPDQMHSLSNAFRGFISRHNGQDISANGAPVFGGSKSDQAETEAVSQFVGSSVPGGWNNTTIVLEAPDSGAVSDTSAGSHWEYPNGKRNPGVEMDNYTTRIDMAWKGNRTNPSELARTMIHEWLHHYDQMGMVGMVNDQHRAIDTEARRRLKAYGLGGGGCSTVGDEGVMGWITGPTYPGCQ